MRLRSRLGLTDEDRGQILVIFALGLVALLAMAALAIDVSNAYATRRFYRAVADAAALAGAADLQGTTRVLTGSALTDAQTTARTHALTVLKDRLGATSDPTCPVTADMVDCAVPGTPFRITIKTPAGACQDCDLAHAVQVGVHNPTFSLSFARILGMNTWDVGITSVAGLTFASKYALATLQPPHPKNNGTDANINKDIVVSGNNTVLNILRGDIGTNTSATTTNQGLIQLLDGYFIEHYDDLSALGNVTWTQINGLPAGKQIYSLIPDPGYMYPSFSGAPTFTTQSAGVVPCTGAGFPSDYVTLLATATCYQPGIYADPQGFNVGTGVVAYLLPGAYSFTTGMSVGGSLAGGLVSGQPGVVLQFPESGSTARLVGNNAVNILLNAGGSTCTADTCRASPAVDFASQQVKTPEGYVLTIEVTRDGSCFSGLTPLDTGACQVNNNATVNLAGNGQLTVAGVIYGPSDNMSIHANQTTQTGVVGQIFAWSVAYTGGATLNQSYPGSQEIGVVRLDAACTAPGTPCSP